MSKIYRVSYTNFPVTVAPRFVRANNRQSAINFVARDCLIGSLATQDELVQAVSKNPSVVEDVILMSDGSKIEITGSSSDTAITGINDEVLF